MVSCNEKPMCAEIFNDLAANGQATVMVTHDIALASRARRIVKMHDG